jgi:hypothetical protein
MVGILPLLQNDRGKYNKAMAWHKTANRAANSKTEVRHAEQRRLAEDKLRVILDKLVGWDFQVKWCRTFARASADVVVRTMAWTYVGAESVRDRYKQISRY